MPQTMVYRPTTTLPGVPVVYKQLHLARKLHSARQRLWRSAILAGSLLRGPSAQDRSLTIHSTLASASKCSAHQLCSAHQSAARIKLASRINHLVTGIAAGSVDFCTKKRQN